MTGRRIYLDWNASAPLRPEAKRATISAMDVMGNPSSVHREGRAAKAIVESARAALAEAFGRDVDDVVFTSGATEAAALALSGRDLRASGVEHDAVLAWTAPVLETGNDGMVRVDAPSKCTLQLANSETGIVQPLPAGISVSDATQAVGKIEVADRLRPALMAIASAHKLGGPKGVGALLLSDGEDVMARQRGGGQELGRRSGTENVAAIAGFAAAVKAAAAEVSSGDWEEVGELRGMLEDRLRDTNEDVVIVGCDAERLPNTTCFAMPGWKSEMQVIQMDLDGFAISAGSACSSGKVRDRNALKALGVSEAVAGSAVRVSFGPTTTWAELEAFADNWSRRCKEHKARRRTRPAALRSSRHRLAIIRMPSGVPAAETQARVN